MAALTRKLIRDLLQAKWQHGAIAVMVALGVTFFNAAYSTYVNLEDSYATSYRRLNFEDFGIRMQPAPERVVERIRSVPGVRAAEGRLVEDVAIEIPGKQTKKLVGRLISIPTTRGLRVNELKLISGNRATRATERGVLLEASFAEYHKLRPGAWIVAKRGSSEVRLRVQGIVQSVEYLYVVRSKQDLIAFPDTFGVMFVQQDVLGPLVGKPNQINEIRVSIWDASKLDLLMRISSDALKTYRPEDPVPRADQPSYQMLQQDVKGFQAYAILFPVFFLSVAAATVYTLLVRSVHQQRSVIGLLRSIGFSRAAVIAHYLGGSLLIGVIGALAGTGTGIWLAGWISEFYMAELQVPYEQIVPRWTVTGLGIVIGIATCAIAGIFPARFAASIPPAEAMRPAVPSFGRRSLRVDWLLPEARLMWRIPLRNIFRQPRRTVSTLFGIIAGVTLMVLAKGLLDSSEVAINEMVSGSFRYDLKLGMLRAQNHAVVHRVASWPGVVRAEGTLDVPVEMRHGRRSYEGLLSGLEGGSSLQVLKDERGRRLTPTPEGAIFGPTLKKRLGLEVGDAVEVALPDALGKEKPSKRLIRVGGFNDESVGTVAYLPYDELGRLFRKDLELPPNAITGISVMVRPGHIQSVRERLLDLPSAGSVTTMPEIRTMVKDMMKTMQRFVWIMELFGAALAFAMIFNMVTINVLERQSEIATLRTIGASKRQIAGMITAENMTTAVIGVLLGLPVARWFVHFFWRAAQTEEQQDLFTFKIQILPETYAMAVGAILAIVAVSQIPALIHAGRLDLAKATKERTT